MTGRSKLAGVAAFEFRYQARSPLFVAAAGLFFLAAFFDMAVVKLVNDPGGTILFNSPHAIIKSSILASILFMFVGAAIVSNAVNRDVQTGFGPLVRATGLSKRDYLAGRFLGAFAVALLVLAAAPLGAWIGTLMPFADGDMIGPNRLSGYAVAFGLFALPNALVIAAILFALATATRSTAGTFFGVLGILIFYLVGQRLMEGEPDLLTARTLADPLGMAAYMASARYLTAAQINAGAIAVTDLMLLGRLVWMLLAAALLGLTYVRFCFAERAPSIRRQRRLARRAAKVARRGSPHDARAALPDPSFGTRAAIAQFRARASLEARFVMKSPAFIILLIIAFAFTLPGLLGATGMYGTPLVPTTSIAIPIIEASFRTVLIVVAAFYAGELVWRERERKIHEIVDVAPMPQWTLMLPKLLGLVLVLWSILAVGLAVGILAQAMAGAAIDLRAYLDWYLLPNGVDAVIVAALALLVQVLAPSKYAGWGAMLFYILMLLFGPSLGLHHPLLIYGRTPEVTLSGMTGAGNFGAAAWWLRLFWASVAVLLLVAAQRLWRRGTEPEGRSPRLAIRRGLSRPTAIVAGIAMIVASASGVWIAYNTLAINDFSAGDHDAYLAAYEKKYLRFARLAQPTVRHVDLDVDIFPAEARAEARGRYRLVNETGGPIDQLHVRLLDRDLDLLSLDLPGARLERDDRAFDYRIYRLDRPMMPGEARMLAFHTRRHQRGFRAADAETEVVANGSNIESIHLLPRIGMSDAGMIEAPATRRAFGLPERRALPALDDLAAARLQPSGDLSWITSDIRVSTTADQIALAPGDMVSQGVAAGRRTARFVSASPMKFDFAIFSGRYAVRRQRHEGVDFAVFHNPADARNVDRMMRAMTASIDYFGRAFGPYPFRRATIVEQPYGDGGHANASILAIAEQGPFAMDVGNPGRMDMVTMVTAHEFAHQWWGQQVTGARMQGGAMLYESLAQYSALMILKRLQGEAAVNRFLAFQQDRYLSGRRTALIPEQPLAAVEISQSHISYGKGALALYQVQQRIGEAAMNRALKRFVGRYRFTTAPYPRSLDLIALLRAEAGPNDQSLITDLFERITLWDLEADLASARRRPDGKWDVAVPVVAHKAYADGEGRERSAPVDERIDISLFAVRPDDPSFEAADLIASRPVRIRSGRQVVRFVAVRPPAFAAIDPNHAFIDRNGVDNITAVKR